MRCILADDSSIFRKRWKSTARAAGYDVVAVASSGQEALKLCEQHRPDLVVLDMIMPPLDGDVAAGVILDAGTAKRVMVVSSNSQEAMFGPLRERGVYLLTKPHSDEQFVAKLHAIAASLTEA